MSNLNLDESDIDNLYEASEIAISKNKESKKISSDAIEDYLDLAALIAFFEGYYNWVMENVNQKNWKFLIILKKRITRKIHILLKQ